MIAIILSFTMHLHSSSRRILDDQGRVAALFEQSRVCISQADKRFHDFNRHGFAISLHEFFVTCEVLMLNERRKYAGEF